MLDILKDIARASDLYNALGPGVVCCLAVIAFVVACVVILLLWRLD